MSNPTTLPLAQRITPGPLHLFGRTLSGRHGFPICDMRNDEIPDAEMLANTDVIREAFQVTEDTQRTPRQLADERADLIAALRLAEWSMAPPTRGALKGYVRPELQKIRDLLTRLSK